MKKILLIIFLLPFLGFSQVTGDYRSVGTGNWTTLSSWERYDGITWVTPTADQGYPGQISSPAKPVTGAVLIQAGHTISIGTSGITTQAMGTVTINGELSLTGIGTGQGTTFDIKTSKLIVTPALSPVATIVFQEKVSLVLPANVELQVNTGGLSTFNGCNNNQKINIGSINIAFCTGTTTFTNLMNNGGYNTAGTLSGNQYLCLWNTSQFNSTVTGGVWSSSNTSIATVSTTGLVKAVGVGTAIISYTKSGVTTSTRNIYVANNGGGGGVTAIDGSNSQCQGTTASYTITSSSTNYNHIWSYSGTGVTFVTSADGRTATATFASNATSGTITVNSTNGCGTGYGINKYVVVAPTSYGGNVSTIAMDWCVNPYNLYIGRLNLSGHAGTIKYWEYSTVSDFSSGVMTRSDEGNGINIQNLSQTTYYRAVVQNLPCTNIAYSNVCKVTVSNAVPSAGGEISGPSSVCSGQTGVAYSVPTIANASGYNWSLPAGATIASGSNTNSITVNFSASANSGNITVNGKNNCGEGVVSANFAITINPLLTTPTAGTVTQPTCAVPTGSFTITNYNSSYTYSVAPSTGVMVNGDKVTAPAGTYTITATSVSCGSASSNVVINNIPNTKTWNGTNWLLDNGSITTAPTIENPIVFNGDFSSNADVEACSCQVNSGKNVVFKSVGLTSGHTLKTINQVRVLGTGTLTFENNASLVQVNDDAVNSGKINYHRHTAKVKRYDYTYWSSPVEGQTMYNLSPKTFYDKYYSYDSRWVVNNYGTLTMNKGEGYIIRAPQDHDINVAKVDETPVFKGVPHNGIVEKDLEKDKEYLLGNPYPSAINADVFLEKNKDVLEGTIYFWTHNSPPAIGVPGGDALYSYTTNDYASYNRTGGVGNVPKALAAPTGAGSAPTGKIAAGQGFFALTKAAGTLVFNNIMRYTEGQSNYANLQFFKSSGTSKSTATTIEKNRVWLNFTNKQGAFKQTLVGYITGATNDYEGSFDGISFDGNAFVDFYSINQGNNLSIQGRALPFVKKDSVVLGYKTKIKGEFQISIDTMDGVLATQNIFVEDQDLKVLHDLKKEPYTFSTEVGTFNDRFVLRYVDKNVVEVIPEPEAPEVLYKDVLVSVRESQIKINSPVELIDNVIVYNAGGRKLYQKDKVVNNELVIQHLISSHQVLLVDILLTNGTKITRKIVY